MTHFTLHGPNGATLTLTRTPRGYDGVGWCDDTRASLIDDVSDPRSLWQTACWAAAQLGHGDGDAVGEVMARLLQGETVEEIGSGRAGEICELIQRLTEARG